MSISLDSMAALARALVDADAAVEQAEVNLKDAKERARVLREETIPSAMQELGLEEIKLDTGQKLSVKQDVYASIPSDKKEEAYNWLDANGFGGLIKVEVKTDYPKGEAQAALQLFQELQDRGLNAQYGQNVHAQTLKAFLREQIAAGSNVPLDLFGARPVWTAKLSNR